MIYFTHVFNSICACYTTFQVLTKGVTPIFKIRSELTSPVIQQTIEDVHGSQPDSSLVTVSSDLDGMNHRESAVVMVSFDVHNSKKGINE